MNLPFDPKRFRAYEIEFGAGENRLVPVGAGRSASPDQLRITLSWRGTEPSSRRIIRTLAIGRDIVAPL